MTRVRSRFLLPLLLQLRRAGGVLGRHSHHRRRCCSTTGTAPCRAAAVEAGLALREKTSVVVDMRRIVKLTKSPARGPRVVNLADSGDAGEETSKTEGFLVHKPREVQNGSFASQLSLQMTPDGDIRMVSPTGATNVKGVFTVGDCGNKMKTVVNAILTGSVAAAMVSAFVQAEAAEGDPKPQ
ncbi:hypothetical protein MFIFM68171_09436 [Madurella fahalii]|uniref:FAD/NAD(P)-binding domain-containing protein n=1 Tax=Madurella fahalii TaxID=1157608 RepID=A0ABQ0GND4_9PEZI